MGQSDSRETTTPASKNSDVIERCVPQFMNYQLVGGTISIMIWHADSEQRKDNGALLRDTAVHKINNCNLFASIEELLDQLKKVNRTFISERIILSVGFHEGRMKKFVYKKFMRTFDIMIHVLRDKGCREMLVTNVPPCALKSRYIRHWMSLQSLNAGIKKFCDKTDDLHFCNIFQLFCYPIDYKRRKEYVINNIRNYHLNIELYNVTSAHHPRSYKDPAVIFSDKGKEVLWQHIKKTIEYRTNQLTMPPIKSRSLLSSKLEKKRDWLVNKAAIESDNRFLKNSHVRPEEISRLHSSNTKVSNSPTRAHIKRNAADDTKNKKINDEVSKENAFLRKLLLDYCAFEPISTDDELNRTTSLGETNNGFEDIISSTEEFWTRSSKKKSRGNRRKRELTINHDDGEVSKNHGGIISSHFNPTKTSSNVTNMLNVFARYKRNTLAYEISKLKLRKNDKDEVPSLTTVCPLKNANDKANTTSSIPLINLDSSSIPLINLDSSDDENEEQGVSSWQRGDEKKLKQDDRSILQLNESSKKQPKIKHDPNKIICNCDPCLKWHRQMLHELSELIKELEEEALSEN